MFRSIGAAFVVCALVLACGGEPPVTDDDGVQQDPTVTDDGSSRSGGVQNPLTFVADENNGLMLSSCVQERGEARCARYPNPMACEEMVVEVARDGTVCAVCRDAERNEERVCGGPMEGIPVLCTADHQRQCRFCTDVFGEPVFDECNEDTQLYEDPVGPWTKAPGKAGSSLWLTTRDTHLRDVEGKTDAVCDPQEYRKIFALEVNRIFQSEGIPMTYTPDLSEHFPMEGYFGYHYGFYGGQNYCDKWLGTPPSWMTKCWSKQPNKCFCMDGFGGSKKLTCRCARIGVLALRLGCKLASVHCKGNWQCVATLMIIYGKFVQWIFKLGLLNCLGTPLALDLDGDGVQTVPPGAGVTFDLMGMGPMAVPWIAPGDALLVMDRNGNGRIDDGSELFGSGGSDLAEPSAPNGFAALAELDAPAMGGNGNGLLEEGDLLFGELQLWRDRNTDGRTQQGELTSLSAAGVTVLDLAAGGAPGTLVDAHGNDHSLQTTFTRTDGSKGALVDVMFNLSK